MSYLSDDERRILLAALRREKEFCSRQLTNSKECVKIVQSLERKFQYDRFEQEIRDKAIEEFVNWSYLHGIDFSYMSTAKKSGRQFCDDVINRYKTEQMKGVDE